MINMYFLIHFVVYLSVCLFLVCYIIQFCLGLSELYDGALDSKAQFFNMIFNPFYAPFHGLKWCFIRFRFMNFIDNYRNLN